MAHQTALRRLLALLLMAACLIVGMSVSQGAHAGPHILAEMDHRTWTARDGAPQGVLSLAQGIDGVLWIGAESGLYTFDGRQFRPPQVQSEASDLLADAVTTVKIGRDGAVWAGFRNRGVVRILHGHITVFDKADNKPLTYVSHFQLSTNGVLWALSGQQRPIRLGADDKWHLEASPLGETAGPIHAIFIDSSNTLWLAQGGRLFRRPLGQSRYFPTEVRANWVGGFVETPDHSLWITDGKTEGLTGQTQHLDPSGKLLGRLPSIQNVSALLFTRDGALIQTPYRRGIQRFPPDVLANPGPAGRPAYSENYEETDGLTSNSANTLLLDRDENIWVGGRRGLDRFRRSVLVPLLSKNKPDPVSLCASPNGDLRIASSGWIAAPGIGYKSEVLTLRGEETQRTSINARPVSISCGPNGDAWLVTQMGFWNILDGQVRPIPPVPEARPFEVRQVVATRDHQLFALVEGASKRAGIWRYRDARWTLASPSGTSHFTPYVLYLDRDDRLWAGYRDGLIALPLEGGLRFSSGRPGIGTVYAILGTAHGLLAGGLDGLGVLRNERFELLRFTDHASGRGISGMVETNDGDLWLNTSHGLVHVTADEMRAATTNPQHRIRSELITEGDYTGSAALHRGKSTAAKDANGRLWLISLNGVFHLDPGRLQTHTHLPTVSLQSIFADQRPVRAGEAIGPGVRTLDIQYLGVNLTAPEKVTYRYRLDGLDTEWQDAEHRTEAVYPRLRPGTYVFRVMASNGDGVWTAPVSSSPIKVLPRFYQTTWFPVICIVAGILLLWLAFTLRIRVVSREIRARAEERADERIRIARDLHDTLLQGIQGLLLTFHVAAQKISPDAESKIILERALSTADRIIIEGRNRVTRLRSEHLTDAELLGALESVASDLGHGGKVELQVRRQGIDVALQPHVSDAVFHIAREAMTNAFRHADASRIEVTLRYGRRLFSTTIQDDGCGLARGAEDKPGHWGLKGMRERALELGCELDVDSQSARGTRIELVIPAHRAYAFRGAIPFLAGLVRARTRMTSIP